jgi:L-amino acid N-acyltransferase YncA
MHAQAVPERVTPPAPAGVTIRPMRAADADQVLAIYQAGLDTGEASFETTAPTWDRFDATRHPQHRHVAVDATTGRLVGWVAVTAVSDRCVYAGVVEHSVYVHPADRGRGIGTALLDALIGSTESAGVWTIQSGIFPENAGSLRLHRRAGFRVVGTRHRIGRNEAAGNRPGRWRDVLLIERRSRAVGID